MSQFAGVCHFDLRPVSEHDQAAIGALQYRAPGLLMGSSAGSIAVSPAGNCICWDGRLDIRRDLLRLTGLPEATAPAALLLELYQKSGVEGLRNAVGDWSLCIWDARLRSIILASDYAGIRPLYYCHRSDGLYWATTLDGFVRWLGATALDETYAAGFLLHGSVPSRTPYSDIFSVPPGHAICVSESGIAKRAFWSLPVHQEIRYADERTYEDVLLALFRDAVEVRIHDAAPVCAELSGGLDSSSVVCMAHRLQRDAGAAATALHTFSYTHKGNPDEQYFLEVERACNLPGCHMQIGDYPPVAAGLPGNAAPAWWEPRFRELAGRMAAIGSSVLLTGQLGDFIMGSTNDDSDQVTECFDRRQYWKACKEAYGWAKSLQVPLYPILWRSFRAAYFSWIPPSDPRTAVGAIPTSMEDSLVDRLRASIADLERGRDAEQDLREIPPGRRRKYRVLRDMLQGRILQAPEALQHVSWTHPFAHRPLVEFLLTIPAGVVCRPKQPRRLMRRSFAALLPSLVLNRNSKAAYSAAYTQALMPLAETLLKGSGEIQLVARGYVDGASLAARLEKFTQGLDCNQSQLGQLLLFEFWLRSRETAGRAVEPLPAQSRSPLLSQV